MIKTKYTNREEIRQMDIFKWIESEKCGYDLGDQAYITWIEKYASSFRKFANTLPELCVECGLRCNKDSSECIKPFNEHRIKFLVDTSNLKCP